MQFSVILRYPCLWREVLPFFRGIQSEYSKLCHRGSSFQSSIETNNKHLMYCITTSSYSCLSFLLYLLADEYSVFSFSFCLHDQNGIGYYLSEEMTQQKIWTCVFLFYPNNILNYIRTCSLYLSIKMNICIILIFDSDNKNTSFIL